MFQELEEVPMTIVGGFDVHRKQITFDYVDDDGLVVSIVSSSGSCCSWLCGLAVEPGEEVVEVGGGEFPFEFSCGLVVAGLERGQLVGNGIEVSEVVG